MTDTDDPGRFTRGSIAGRQCRLAALEQSGL